MVEKPEITIESVKLLVREFVKQLCPHEINAFEMSFGQLTHWPHHWEHIEPAEWKVEDLLAEVTVSGYAFPGIIPGETPPWFHFGLVVHAVAEHFRRLGKVPEAGEIEAAYKKFASQSEFPKDVFDVGKPAAIKFVQSYFRGHFIPFSPTVGYVVYEGQKRHTFREENKLEKFRAKKKTYDIYVDDLKSEILVNKKKPNLLAGETSTFYLLKCLLRKVGSYWTHDALLEELRRLDPNPEMRIVETDDRILLHRMLDSLRESLSAKAGKIKVKQWFDTSKPKRVVVASNLKSCLIEFFS
ncbi:MAG: hypothetical protein KAV87_54470 [Desulfobacteraceae bacterium]|nr:hypothetical protein [Desulfobacteraceae bacterium]